MSADTLAQVVRALPSQNHPDLLFNAEAFGDAGIFRLSDSVAIAQSVDFFAPLVDDPFQFGQIAAANALSDLYAVGATPRTVLNVAAFPEGDLDPSVFTEILRGGAERVAAAGAVVLGGHSVRDTEIKFGLAVTGTVDPERMLSNDRATPGQVLMLTKPLGTGFITTAHRAGRCPSATLDSAIQSMIGLNRDASIAAIACGATGATDVTGFGLVGHALEVASASNVTLTIETDRLPVLPGGLELAVPENYSSAVKSNRAHVEPNLEMLTDGPRAPLVFDPQTSGGLLIAVPEDQESRFVELCPDARAIGYVEARSSSAALRIR